MSATGWTVVEMREMCDRMGLETSGTKTVLWERVNTAIQKTMFAQPREDDKETEEVFVDAEDESEDENEPAVTKSPENHVAQHNLNVSSSCVTANPTSSETSVKSLEAELQRFRHEIVGEVASMIRQHLKPSEQNAQSARSCATQQSNVDVELQQARQRVADLELAKTQPQRHDRITIQQASDSMPIFDPEDATFGSSELFIWRVRALQEFHGWDDKLVLFAAQQKLRGVAKTWNDTSRTLFRTFEEFVSTLTSVFPDTTNAADVQAELAKTARRPNEKLRNYCHRMIAIAQRGMETEATVVRHIQNGMNHENFRVAVVNTPLNSYAELHGAVARYEMNFPNTKTTSGNETVGTFTTTSSRPNNLTSVAKNDPPNEYRRPDGSVYCYNCRERGHIATTCRKPIIKCTKCYRHGHVEANCSFKTEPVLTIVGASGRDHLEKDVLINNVRMCAFIDGGSKRSLIRRSAASKIEREEPCDPIQLQGFGGKKVLCTTKISPTVKLDGTIFRAELYVVVDDALPTDVLLGTELLCRDGNRLVIAEGICFIEPTKTDEKDIRPEISELMIKYPKCFSRNLNELGTCKIHEMKIELTCETPIYRRAYRMPMAKRMAVDNMITELLDNGIIRPSVSSFASPALLVKKSNGEDRLCIDYRELNNVTVKQAFPMPIIEELLESVAGYRFFTTLDLMAGYHQVMVEEESRKYTAFVTHNGHYEYVRMPFGLVNAPSVFQRIMNDVCKKLPPGFVLSYLDDTIIPSMTEKEGLQKIDVFLSVIESVGLTLRLDKCVFLSSKITFLGHKVSANGIEPGDKKISAIEQFPAPIDVPAVRRFLGMTGFYRKFVSHYASIAKPLTLLLRTTDNPTFEWSQNQQEAFDTLKTKLASSPVLSLFDVTKEHEVHSDASKDGLAGVLLQKEESGMHPVFYYSRKCTALERTSPSYELEVLAIVEACERFRVYLIGRHFRIVTDCSAVTTLRLKSPLQPKVARWWLKLLEYDFELIHRPGTQLAYVDAMSRAPTGEAREIEGVGERVMRIDIDENDWLATMQMQDPNLRQIVSTLNGTNNTDDTAQIRADYVVEGCRLFRLINGERKWVVPKNVRWRMVKSAHDDRGHFGLEKTLQHLQQKLWFARMRNFVKSYLAACVECCYNKRPGGTTEGRLHFSETVPIPFRTVHIDHIGPFPKSSRSNSHVIGLADEFSKYVVLKAVKTTNTRSAIALLSQFSNVFGLPARIVTDRGTAFTSRVFADYCEKHDIKHIQNAVRTPRANGQIERVNSMIGAFLRTTTTNDNKWDDKLDGLQWTINSQINKTSNCCPNDVVFRFKPRDILQNRVLAVLNCCDDVLPEIPSPEVIAAHIDEQKAAWKERYDSRHRLPKTYTEGDLVLVEHSPPATGDSRKLEPKYRGPYVVANDLGRDRYLIRDIENMQRNQRRFESVFSSEKIKPWCSLGPDYETDDSESDNDVDADENMSGVGSIPLSGLADCEVTTMAEQ